MRACIVRCGNQGGTAENPPLRTSLVLVGGFLFALILIFIGLGGNECEGTMNIRQATQEDWEQILALIGMFPKELKQTNLTSYRSFFVADVLGEIVGCCSAAVMVLEDPADPNEIPKEMEIRSLAVKPGWEGQGIATMLVAGCEKRRLELRIRQGLALASEAARRVFEAAGYATDDGSKYALFKEESR